MRVSSLYTSGTPTFSFEFFPPHDDEGVASLFATIAQLRDLDPGFVSVTYGAGGSTRTRTVELVGRIRRELDITPVAHLTCVGADREDLRDVLARIVDAGVENVMALRGDPPRGQATFTPAPGGLAHGSDLVALITQSYDLCVGAACYPETHLESASPADDIRYTREKQDRGAEYLVTQLFFDNQAYFRFVAEARAAGVTVPIVPGIIPLTSTAQLHGFIAKLRPRIPEPLLSAVEARGDDPQAVLELGVAWSSLQCAELLSGGAPGIHFFTMNRSPSTRAILTALRSARPWENRPAGAVPQAPDPAAGRVAAG
ncbi:MAG: methylenetetrahydrofolate reductase [NAD(P)H] [Candidatus Dormibacteria bacterium]|jgi:methylenetetrahydrofolate reductase (NADPH)